MELTRRDFLRASAALAAAWGLDVPGAWAASPGRNAGPSVVWLQAQSCTGCSVSLLNTIYYMTVDTLLTSTINLDFHSSLMNAAGKTASDAAMAAATNPSAQGYVLVVEGAVPTGPVYNGVSSGRYCYLWPGMTALAGVKALASKANFVLAVGSCSAYGGVAGGQPNPTGVQPLSTILTGKRVVNIPGCPTHPDWIIATIAYLIKNKKAPELDSAGRPKSLFEKTVHEQCPYRDDYDEGEGGGRCFYRRGCKGPYTHCDCPTRKWNGPAANTTGINWCIGAGNPNGTPCQGCTEPGFPDTMSPFYAMRSRQGGGGGGNGGGDDDEHEDGYSRGGGGGSYSTQPDTATVPSGTQPGSGAAAPSDLPADDQLPPLQWDKRQEYLKRTQPQRTSQPSAQVPSNSWQNPDD